MKGTSNLIVFTCTLLALIANVYAADDNSLNDSLHNATARGDKAEVEALLAKGANVNSTSTNGYTLLASWAIPSSWATSSEKKAIAELLIAKGADVNAKSLFERTPLHVAASMGNKDAAEFFLAQGADVNAKDINRYTPLHSAVRQRSKEIVELLLFKGADINAKNNVGMTPLDMAVEMGEKAIAELLKEHPVKQARLLEFIRSNPPAAFVELIVRLKGAPADDSTRRLIIKLASEMMPAPAIPEEARKHFIEGTAIVKTAKNPAQQALAAQSFTEALKVAPWWGDAYYNLGVAQELAEQYNEAEKALTFYLLSNPGEAEKRDAQDRIYALSAKRKLLGAK